MSAPTPKVLITLLIFLLKISPAFSYAFGDAKLVQAQHGMVASQEKLASEVGVDILKQGGNAVDAAVAVGYALAVTLPEAGNIGGGGFMLIYQNEQKKAVAINYREKAPGLAHRDVFLDAKGNVDHTLAQESLLSTGVPGTVAGLNLAQRRFGKLTLKQVMAPAIKLARHGFKVPSELAKSLHQSQKLLARFPASKAIFFKADGKPLATGDILVQTDLANALQAISERGDRGFYQGKTAKLIAKAMQQDGGLINTSDLKNYRAEVLPALQADFKDYTIYAMPPPSSGGITLLQILKAIESYPLKELGAYHPDSLHQLTELMNQAYLDRSKYIGDPKFYPVPTVSLLSDERISQMRQQVNPQRHRPPNDLDGKLPTLAEGTHTTHYSIVDADGNMVSNTYTLNSYYGNGYVVPGTGILLNNEMDDFSAKAGVPNQFGVIGGKANAIAANKQPLSSMAPTIITDQQGKAILATGSPGGSRIITTVLQTLLNTLVYEMDIAQALSAERIHSQAYPDQILVEAPLPEATAKALRARGHKIVMKRPMGSVQTVAKNGGKVYGASDPRKGGAAVGY